MQTENITIEGMTCHHCVMTVEKELQKLPVKNLSVRIGGATMTYEEEVVSHKDIRTAVEEAGYTLIE